jgi:hypothetical protein
MLKTKSPRQAELKQGKEENTEKREKYLPWMSKFCSSVAPVHDLLTSHLRLPSLALCPISYTLLVVFLSSSSSSSSLTTSHSCNSATFINSVISALLLAQNPNFPATHSRKALFLVTPSVFISQVMIMRYCHHPAISVWGTLPTEAEPNREPSRVCNQLSNGVDEGGYPFLEKTSCMASCRRMHAHS